MMGLGLLRFLITIELTKTEMGDIHLVSTHIYDDDSSFYHLIRLREGFPQAYSRFCYHKFTRITVGNIRRVYRYFTSDTTLPPFNELKPWIQDESKGFQRHISD